MTPSINRRGESLHSLEKKFSCYLNKKGRKKRKKSFYFWHLMTPLKRKKNTKLMIISFQGLAFMKVTYGENCQRYN